MTKTKGTLIVAAVLAVGVLGGLWLERLGVGQPAPVPAPALPPPLTAEGQNGLGENERTAFYHLSEGGELFPVDWLLALEVESTAIDGTLQVRPFLDNIERYGLLSDPKSVGNPDGLPVGISLGLAKAEKIEMIGLNCTACHVGQVQYQERAVRIDGLGNMALINGFLADLASETEKTLKSPRRLVRFWKRVRDVRKARRARGSEQDVVADDETMLRRIASLVSTNRDLVEAKLNVLKGLPTLLHSIDVGAKEGPGRLDAFGIGRDELFGGISGNSVPPDAPVSFPHIWGMEYTGWLQWGANTDSVMERNIGQALGVGAIFDPKTWDSTVRIDNLHRMEEFAYKLTAPVWPASFPAIDTPKVVEAGKALFTKNCAHCHEKYDVDGQMRTYQLFSVAETGTDPMTALGFDLPVKQSDGVFLPFPYAAMNLIKNIKLKAYEEAGYDAKTIDLLEQRQTRKGPQWAPTFRATLLDSAKYKDTAGRKVYRAKTLVGIWATAPFLHNGSVPTIDDLLQPAANRPVTFPVGQREYDPVKLGIQTDPARFTLAPDQQPFIFDTRLQGNWNTGHEWEFYPLGADDRHAIIEFLKTYTTEMSFFPETARALAGGAEVEQEIPPPQASRDSAEFRAFMERVLLWLVFGLIVAAALGWAFFLRYLMPNGEAARATEDVDIATLTQGILTLQRKYAADQNRPLGRGTHTKGICVGGQFEVFDVDKVVSDRALAARLKQGMFAKPGVYPATIRFANGASLVNPDRTKDVRAMSFAVDLPPGVAGPAAMRQDFSCNNATIFPLNDAHAFAVAIRIATASSVLKGIWSLSFRDKMIFARIAVLGAQEEKPPKAGYQQTSYWSTVPYRHGPADVIKYSATACAGNSGQPLGSGPNCLQDELVRHLNEDPQMSGFDFGLQLLDVETMTYLGKPRSASFWIENASVEWKESQAPYHLVGRLTLAAKSQLAPDVCAAWSIDVTANSTPDSRPLGSINRARPVGEGASRKARLGQAQL